MGEHKEWKDDDIFSLSHIEVKALKGKMARDLKFRYGRVSPGLACAKVVAGVNPIADDTLAKVTEYIKLRDSKPADSAGEEKMQE